MNVLVIGAHGRTGRHIARQLHARSIPFKVLLRRAAHEPEFAALGAAIVLGDLAQDFSDAFDAEVTHVIYAAGSTGSGGREEERQIDRDAVKQTADHANRLGVRKLIVISSLSAPWPELLPSGLHYSQMKREGDDYVEASGVDYVILRPGELSDERGVGTIALASERQANPLPVAREDVATAAVESLANDLSRKVIGFVGGPTPIAQALRVVKAAV
jgi:uncharacterized protein YbjT (DUF2867 family)